MGLFTSHKAKEPAYIVCTVEAHSVSCAVYLRKEKPEIIFAVRDNAVYRTHPDTKRIFNKVNKLFKDLLVKNVLPFIKHNGDQYEFVEAMIIHSLLWSHEETRHLSHHEDKEFALTEKYVSNIVESEHKNVSKNANYIVVKSSISDMHINGYASPSMYGKKAKSFSCTLQRILIDKSFVESLGQSLESVVRAQIIHSTEFDLFDVFMPFVGSEASTVAISFGSETTEVAVYNHMQRKNSLSAGFGIETLVRNTSAKVHADESVSFSHILGFARGDRLATKMEILAIEESMKQMKQKIVKEMFDHGETFDGVNSVICIYPESYKDICMYFIKNILFTNSVSIIDPYTNRNYKDFVKISEPIFYTDPLVEIAVLSANKK